LQDQTEHLADAEEERMHEEPRLKDTLEAHLSDIIAKRGWDAATFAQAVKTPVAALSPAQARMGCTKGDWQENRV
jgi:hypothetical protein